jgi:N6-adenosine-specific RNA methylase IME4
MSAAEAVTPTAAFHPFADLFPLMEGAEFEALVADIKANGLMQPIVEYEHAILDGRNRYRACIAAGVTPSFEPFSGDDPLRFVVSANLKRRHLNIEQRAMVGARLETMKQGRPRKDATVHVLRGSAAQVVNVSPRTIATAKAVMKTATREIVALVERGQMPVAVAAKVAKLPPEKQREIAKQPPAQAKGVVKSEMRAKRESEFSKATKAASEKIGSALYGVIYADPPWRFEPRSRITGMDRAADNHYPTMTVDDICAIKPPAAPDCALFMWATAPMLLEALDVIDAWGFTYKTHLVWVKDRVGTGYWVRSQHELLLIATRGNVPAPAPGQQYASVIDAAVQKHSAKPIAFAEAIEEMFPTARLLEMFARESRAGWDVWGNEVIGTSTKKLEAQPS